MQVPTAQARSSGAPPAPQRFGAGPGSGHKGDGKGKGKIVGSKLPLVLRVAGASGVDPEGNPICFSFNLGGCAGAPPGGRCPKGRHVCVLTKCGQASHGYGTAHGTEPIQ